MSCSFKMPGEFWFFQLTIATFTLAKFFFSFLLTAVEAFEMGSIFQVYALPSNNKGIKKRLVTELTAAGHYHKLPYTDDAQYRTN